MDSTLFDKNFNPNAFDDISSDASIPLNGIIPVWQPIGTSTNIIAKKISEKIGVSTSHTGTLDPMAEGVVIILSGETRKEKYKLAEWRKTYEFEIVFGISTDTFDGMGLITKSNVEDFQNYFLKNTDDKVFSRQNFVKNLEQSLAKFIGDYEQTVPIYSSVRFNKKPLHHHARNNFANINIENSTELELTIPTKKGLIFDLKILKSSELTLYEIVSKIVEKINFVTGDFRQQEIINKWNEFLEKYNSKYLANSKIDQIKLPVIKFQVEMTKGLYVRSLAVDIAASQNTLGFVFDLVRTQNGIYTKDKCFTTQSLEI